MKNSALVVIDLQNDITKNYKEIMENVNAAIDWAVQTGLWVVYIQHNNLSAGTRTFKPGRLRLSSRKTASTSFISPVRMLLPALSLHAITWRKAAIRSMCCRTASPAMIKRSCRSCLRTMQARAALL